MTSDDGKRLSLTKIKGFKTLTLENYDNDRGLWQINQKFAQQKSAIEIIYRRKADWDEKHFLCHNADGQVMLCSELEVEEDQDVCTVWKLIVLDPNN